MNSGDRNHDGRRLWLVRHGYRQDMVDPTWSSGKKRPYDSPLAVAGHAQARDTAARLGRESVAHVFSSPFSRAMETATIIAAELGLPMKVEAGLSEALYKEWFPTDPDLAGQVEVGAGFPGIDTAYRSRVLPSHPEDDTELLDRVGRVTDAVTSEYDGDLLFVAHGGSISGLCRRLVGPVATVHTSTCCLIELKVTGDGWELRQDGSDLSHLSATEQDLRG